MRKVSIYILLLIFAIIGCQNNVDSRDASGNDISECIMCENQKIIKVLEDEPAYIRKSCFEHLGRTDAFCIELTKRYPELHPAGLFPCNTIPEEYRIEGLSVKISGEVYDCLVGGCSEPHIKLAPFNAFKLNSIKLNKQ